eukprot:6049861-Amphidinium_carterae.1
MVTTLFEPSQKQCESETNPAESQRRRSNVEANVELERAQHLTPKTLRVQTSCRSKHYIMF